MCFHFKSKPQREELHPNMATLQLEHVHIDFLTIKSSKTDKEINVTDHLMCYAQAFITPSQTAKVTAQTLCDKLFVSCRFPEKISSDQGYNFKSKQITELCSLAYTKKLQYTPCRPQTNSQCERFNSTQSL